MHINLQNGWIFLHRMVVISRENGYDITFEHFIRLKIAIN